MKKFLFSDKKFLPKETLFYDFSSTLALKVFPELVYIHTKKFDNTAND